VERRLSEMGAALLVKTLEGIRSGGIQPRAQEIDRATYAPKIRAEAARIFWGRNAAHITRLVRAMNPRPGATTSRGSQLLKVWRAATGPARSGAEIERAPGTVLGDPRALLVACGEAGSVILLELQVEGRRRVTGEEALQGRLLSPGDCLEEPTEDLGNQVGSTSPGL
jgi:methionyl-tRNA formyltransferase